MLTAASTSPRACRVEGKVQSGTSAGQLQTHPVEAPRRASTSPWSLFLKPLPFLFCWLPQRFLKARVQTPAGCFFKCNLHTGNMKRMNSKGKRLISDQITISKALLNAFCWKVENSQAASQTHLSAWPRPLPSIRLCHSADLRGYGVTATMSGSCLWGLRGATVSCAVCKEMRQMNGLGATKESQCQGDGSTRGARSCVSSMAYFLAAVCLQQDSCTAPGVYWRGEASPCAPHFVLLPSFTLSRAQMAAALFHGAWQSHSPEQCWRVPRFSKARGFSFFLVPGSFMLNWLNKTFQQNNFPERLGKSNVS